MKSRRLMAGNNGRGNGSDCLLFVLGWSLFAVIFSPVLLPAAENKPLRNMVIGDLVITGNQTITTAKILSRVRSRAGELFNAEAAAEDAKRIGEIEGVEYAYYNTEVVDNKVKLTFVVVEKNVVRTIVLNGNRKVKTHALLKKLVFKKGDYLSAFMAQTGRENLLEYYKERGYASAKVSLDEQQLQFGKVIYNIQEGPRVKIKAVRFEGNRRVKNAQLKNAVKTQKTKWFFWPGHFNEKNLSEDVTKLESLYQKRGFLDTRIRAVPEFTEDRTGAYLTFLIDEGPLYTVDKVTFEGNKFFDDNALLAVLKLRPGAVYSEQRAQSDTKKLLAKFREVGFIDAGAEQKRSFVAVGRVRSDFVINEGERFRIGQIDITGNVDTQDKVIRRILDEYNFRPGQWYNADAAAGTGQGELEKAIRSYAMTDSAAITPTGKKPGQRDAQVSVVEGRTGMVMLGAGVDSSSGLIGQFIFEQRNFDISDWPENWGEFITGKAFKGAGQTLRLDLQPGTQVSQYSLSFTEPYLNDKPISLDVIGSMYERDRESYDETRTKGTVGFEKRLKGGWRPGIDFRAENVTVDSIDSDAPLVIKKYKGDTFLGGAKFRLGKDLTDNKFNPTKGYIISGDYEQVTGDATFGILGGTYRWYKTVHEDFIERKTVLGTRFRAATILGDAPPFEKFYAGGIGSIRGFDYRGVSTRGLASDGSGRKKDPVGSDWIFLANTELTVPLYGESLSSMFFVDSGTIDTGNYRVAVGIGLQILIPQWFGPVPMRFELATPVMKDDADETQVFSFSVGRLF